MKKYLAKFENEAAYDVFKASEDFVTPNVSWCVEENKVMLNPYMPAPQHEYIEIAGIKWATMNIGATAVTDDGLYFQWGDTQGYTAEQVGSGVGKKNFTWQDYKYGNGTTNPRDSGMTKYNPSVDGKYVLDLEDDAAHAAWGGNWRMPTRAEIEALGAAVTTAHTRDYQGSGAVGMVCTDNTDSSKVLFFPAAGVCMNRNVSYKASDMGFYWSKTRDNFHAAKAYSFTFSPTGSVNWTKTSERFYGCTVRAILDE